SAAAPALAHSARGRPSENRAAKDDWRRATQTFVRRISGSVAAWRTPQACARRNLARWWSRLLLIHLAPGKPLLAGGFIMLTVVWTRTDLGRVLINRDWSQRPDQVRFGPLCGLKSDISQGPRSAKSGPEQVQQKLAQMRAYSITSSARPSNVG